MQVVVKPGKYVVAVSGGVDSMVLLDLLAKQPGLELVVAHFEHGIRKDSDEDRKLVESTATTYRLPFVFEQGNLGAHVSESLARDKRYAFLRQVKEQWGADAIITAHHQDDMIETAIINILRGTGRKGLSSLQSTKELVRPLLHTPKQAILEYAQRHDIVWHEDSTNANDAYLRNYIRHTLVPRLGAGGRAELLGHISKAADINPAIDQLLHHDLQSQLRDGHELKRSWFAMLPYDVSCEVMATWLRSSGIREFDRKLLHKLVVGAKVAMPGKTFDINAGYQLKVAKTALQVSRRVTS
jgi:tRNA(Ile)-lysidine synthase